MAIALETGTGSSTIRLDGAIDIGSAAEFKQALLKAFAWGGEVRVALDNARDLDVTAMQLLCAAVREAKATGVQFTLKGGMPQPIASSIADAGLGAQLGTQLDAETSRASNG